jgi:hypothetical protein
VTTELQAGSAQRRREARFWVPFVLVIAIAVGIVLYVRQTDHGDPDPGHKRIDALRPVLSSVPSGAHIEMRDVVNPKWDSCDGKHPGWDDATVDVEFTSALPLKTVVAHIGSSLSTLGWRATSQSDGTWYWQKTIRGSQANVQLLGGPDTSSPDWDLQATVQAATHPIGC